MVNIIIDGKKLQVRDDVTILQAARENGFSIPTLCYLEGLNEIGACRLCAWFLPATQKLRKAWKFLPALPKSGWPAA